MDRKTKNILSISIIVVLIIALILTIHFAKDNNRNFTNDFNMPTMNNNDNGKDNYIGKERPSIPNNKRSDTDESSENKKEIPSDRSFNMDDFKGVNNLPNRGNGVASKYVVLLCVESFLLGGTIMFLIINNINCKVEEKQVKEKSKK